jgi:DNA transformation protein and related proteins
MSDLIAWIEEALAPLGSVASRAMMGGRTLYCDGVIFAILADDDLWFKADATSDAVWDAAGCERFTYDMGGKTGVMNYRRAPGDVHDDMDEMRRWAEIAIAAGLRGQANKKPRKKVKQP